MNKQMLRYVILAGLFVVPFVPFFVSGSLFFPYITTKAFAFRIIVETIFAAWVLLALADAEYRPKRSWILYALFIFIAVIGVADIFGEAPIKSFWSNAERMEGFVSLLHLGMFFVVITSVFRELDWRRWWNTSLIASLLMALYCFFQLLGVLEIHQGGARVDGALGNAAYLAVYLLFHIFVAIFFLAKDTNKTWRWLYISSIFSGSIILYFTATRGAILGLLGGLLVMAVISVFNKEHKGMRRFGLVYITAFVLLLGGFFALKDSSFVKGNPVLARFATISGAEWKSEGRAFVWPMAIQGVKEKPILGWGQENFNYVFNEHYSPEMFMLEPWFDRAHNIFLDWAIAGGVLGLLSYLSLYILFLYYLWRPGSNFSYPEKAVLTGLLSAYFFHNLFVFDHLISYILFASVLALVDSRSNTQRFGGRVVSGESVTSVGLPIAGVVLVALLYFVNIKPIVANSTLISALQQMQTGKTIDAMNDFKYAYREARLGRPEIVEQIAANVGTVLSGNATMEEKNDYFAFAREAVENQAKDVPTDARYQMIAGSFLVNTGQFEAGDGYLKRATELMPAKQAIYFQLAASQFGQNDYQAALATLRHAYELAPDYIEAKMAYLAGAVFAGDTLKEQELLSTVSPGLLMSYPQVFAAYYQTKRFEKLIAILQNIEQNFPEHALQARDYIKQIQAEVK